MKILLTVDHSEASSKAVAFVGQMLGKNAGVTSEVTLFHVVESLPEFIVSRSQMTEGARLTRKFADAWSSQQRDAGRELLDRRRQELQSAGVDASRIQSKLAVKDSLPEARRVVAALSIIEEMKQGNYDLVVLGRRGASNVETFIGSVAEKVLREAFGKSVWIID